MGTNPFRLFSHPLKYPTKVLQVSSSLKSVKKCKLQFVIKGVTHSCGLMDHSKATVVSPSGKSIKPFEYTPTRESDYNSLPFGPSNKTGRAENERKKWRKSRSTFVEQFCELPSTERTITDELARKKNESIQTQTKLKGGQGWG